MLRYKNYKESQEMKETNSKKEQVKDSRFDPSQWVSTFI